jgi:predicted aldo/keto reductase-like oxidoreductase
VKYRQFSNKIDFKPSALGFGLMRLPVLGDGSVNVEESIEMVRYAIDNGVNYLDTAYVYHGEDGYREKVKIADKMPMWLLKEESDLDKIFFDQLEKLQVKKIDFYLLHALSNDSFEVIEKFKALEWLEKKKAEGYIEYGGFSFHDDLDCLKKMVDLHDWDFCLLQVNIIDDETPVGVEGIRYAREKGLGIIIMEPLRGGQLSISIPEQIDNLWVEMARLYGDTDAEPVKYMFDWLWDNEDIGCVISGMSSFEQLAQNIEFASSSKTNKLNKEQLDLYKIIKSAYLGRLMVNCTSCRYCKECPKEIPIWHIFHLLNEVKRYENQRSPSFSYGFINDNKRAKKCINCKICLSLCPQKLEIPDLLKKCSRIFDEKQEFNEVVG